MGGESLRLPHKTLGFPISPHSRYHLIIKKKNYFVFILFFSGQFLICQARCLSEKSKQQKDNKKEESEN